VLRLALLASLAALAVAAGTGLAAGSPKAGKKIFLSSGCGGCHTFKPAGTNGKVGPVLTKARLKADAKRAKQPYALFIRTSIVRPKKFVAKGYSPVMPSFAKLSKKQLDDLVAFVSTG
jgi:cytochrome c oxidase subunit 2